MEEGNHSSWSAASMSVNREGSEDPAHIPGDHIEENTRDEGEGVKSEGEGDTWEVIC